MFLFAGPERGFAPRDVDGALALHDVTDGGGMSATVMTPEGTWSGTTGTADGARDLQVDDQFAIASITKSVVAAQVMLMVEAGELGLDDPVADHLPDDLVFDSNGSRADPSRQHLLLRGDQLPAPETRDRAHTRAPARRRTSGRRPRDRRA